MGRPTVTPDCQPRKVPLIYRRAALAPRGRGSVLNTIFAARRHRMPAAALVAVTVITTTAALAIAPVAHASTPASGPGSATLAVEQVHAPVPTLRWRPCGSGLVCTRADVPLDYDRPNGRSVSLFISKLVARHPGARIGTLFTNPGGPGGSASEAAPYIAQALGPAVRNHFDVIGVDPRGVGGSAPVSCRANGRAPRYPRLAFPLVPRQAPPFYRFADYENKACAQHPSVILDHMSTADTARDMDLIRQALGEEQLTYYGVSYGTLLGSTYAAMFPSRVHAMILDGVLDPIAWSTGRDGKGRTRPFTTRVGSGVGSWDALTSAFAECTRVGPNRCPLAGDATEKWLRIVHRLRHWALTATGAKRAQYSQLTSGVIGYLYSRSDYWYLMREIARIYRQLFTKGGGNPRAVRRAVAALVAKSAEIGPKVGPYSVPGLTPDTGKGYRISDPFLGVSCADSLNPTHQSRWLTAGKFADGQGPWFGRPWTWSSLACAGWQGSSADAFRGPWRVQPANPVLIVGNFHDPATPIRGARITNQLLKGSRLLSLDTWGHGAIGQSACVTKRFSGYLLEGRLPVNGLVCRPNLGLFPPRGR